MLLTQVAALGKSGVSVGYFDTETAAARAYDRAAIGLLGWQNCKAILNYPIEEYDRESIPELVGKSREEVKATLKSERAKVRGGQRWQQVQGVLLLLLGQLGTAPAAD